MSVALAAVINLATGTVHVDEWWKPLVWPLAGLLTLAAIVIEARERRAQRGETSGDLEEAAGWLAGRVRRQWEHEADLRRLHDPLPLQVRWSSTRRPVATERELVMDGPAETGWELLPLRGDAGQITQAYLRLPHGQLVVLGGPGAGKSVLAVLLTLDLLELRESRPIDERGPVPVLISIASWNPEVEHLEVFLTRKLSEEHQRLRRPEGEQPSLAAALVADRRILPVLDGLDELPQVSHRQAVRRRRTAASTTEPPGRLPRSVRPWYAIMASGCHR
ncbi:hypothetical protein HII36_38510 [Nonomuraea sp. NN258]|uniref:hypothetical protein n=1 Tax=Nonomuraea antri TaxID=2730852 RepID=UPI00156986F0|nr:hypothetical protein [Nonomuraea antri]NRQ37681.1 hypothetical protein [Nonomuraea antri]